MRWTLVPVLAAVAASGCQRSEYTFTEVEGHVSSGGRPRPNVVVCFWPDVEAGTHAPRATAVTDAAGHYRLRCDEGTAGAVVGRYRVCLSTLNLGAKPAPRPPAASGPRAAPPGPQLPRNNGGTPPAAGGRIPDCYASFRDTPLRDIDVRKGEAQTLDFEVTAPK